MHGKMFHTEQEDAELATKVATAYRAYEDAKKEKAIVVGKLLVEAQRWHPTDKAFAAFLERAGGIQLRRAQELIAIALGRKGHEQLLKEKADAQQRFRDKQKAEKIARDKAAAAKAKAKPDDALRNAKSKSDDALRNASDKDADPDDADTVPRVLFDLAVEARELARNSEWVLDTGGDLGDDDRDVPYSEILEKYVVDAVRDAAQAWQRVLDRVKPKTKATTKNSKEAA
jgi:hypothetical protein